MSLGVQRHARATLLPRKTRCQLYKRPGGYQSLSGRVWKNLPLLGFGPLTVQSVVSRYTDYAIPPHDLECV